VFALPGNPIFNASLTAMPGIASFGQGTATLEFQFPGTLRFAARTYQTASAVTGAELRFAVNGPNPIGIALPDTTDDVALTGLQDSVMLKILKGQASIVIKTANSPGGELSGRILKGSNATGVRQIPDIVPASYSLGQNYPNPFNPTTKFDFEIPKSGYVSVKIYNVLGEEVATILNGFQTPGKYTASLDGLSLSSGVYFYRLAAGQNFSQVKKMVLMK
jgi:hypothetical protein